MKVDSIAIFQILVDDDSNLFLAVVDQAKGGNRSGFQTKIAAEPLFRSKAEPVFPDLNFELLEPGSFRVLNDNKVVTVALLIAEKEILAMGASYSLPITLSSFDCEDRRMLMPDKRDAELLQNIVNFLFILFRQEFLLLLNFHRPFSKHQFGMAATTIEGLALPSYLGGGMRHSPFQRSLRFLFAPCLPFSDTLRCPATKRAYPLGFLNDAASLRRCPTREPGLAGRRGCLSEASSAAAEEGDEGTALKT